MTESKFSITWKSFKSNLCVGLSSLQQNEEFVDMTLAADGHYVKVHQMVLSLASPYLKELIKSAPCPHPILFLNNISYRTLTYILEYIYSGEVHINKENLNEVLEAGRALHIKGLDATEIDDTKTGDKATLHLEDALEMQNMPKKLLINGRNEARNLNFEAVQVNDLPVKIEKNKGLKQYGRNKRMRLEIEDESDNKDALQYTQEHEDDIPENCIGEGTSHSKSLASKPTMQYTLSNQGNIQLILNRFLYFFRYNYRKDKPSVRLWRCVDYVGDKCPATVTTRDGIVIQRVAAHKHPFHDKKILKKLQSGLVFTAIKDAEDKSKQMGNRKDACIIIRPDNRENLDTDD